MAVRARQAAAADPLTAHELGSSDDPLVALAERIHALCTEAGITLSVAESCTGGLVAHLLTEVSGASGFFEGGAVTYSDALKRSLLDVPLATLERHGAVSAQVAVAMAQGARRRFSTSLGVAVTGIAGPLGGSEAKPVGLTYVALAYPEGHDVRRHHWGGDRSANKRDSAGAALELILDHLRPSA